MKTRNVLNTVAHTLPDWHVVNDRQFGRMAENAGINVELDDSIVFEWCDNDDSSGWDCSPCYGGHRLQTDMTAYGLMRRLGIIDDPYAQNHKN